MQHLVAGMSSGDRAKAFVEVLACVLSRLVAANDQVGFALVFFLGVGRVSFQDSLSMLDMLNTHTPFSPLVMKSARRRWYRHEVSCPAATIDIYQVIP